MKILALEFSSPQRSVAVLHAGSGGATFIAGEIIETGPGATRGLAMADEALCATGFEREQIECLAIGIGPGSYTGTRAAIALAQGWQLARPVTLLGISSVECIAAQAREQGMTGQVHVVVDAQRDEFYLAGYDLTDDACLSNEPLRIVSIAEVKERAASGVLIGPEVRRWFPDGIPFFPHAATLARLASSRSDFVPGERLEPIYLRQIAFVKAPRPRPLPSA